MATALSRFILFGDAFGVPQVMENVPRDIIVAAVAAHNRPASHQAVRSHAEKWGIPFFVQPRFGNTEAYQLFVSKLAALQPDAVLCHSYAMLIRQDILQLVEGHAFNLHSSLLPRNRGPNPIQWALIHGDQQTGVTLHIMDEGFDTGPIVMQQCVPIHDEDSWVTLSARISEANTVILKRALPLLISGQWHATIQDAALACTNTRISPESIEIDFQRMDDRTIFNLIRAQVSPLKGAYVESHRGRVHYDTYMSLSDVSALRHTHG